MANRTDPENRMEKILRSKIFKSTYWKEQCFGLNAETLVDKAIELDHFGGTYGGNRKPTPFMCLVFKMLQIQPHKDIVIEFIKNEDYKYVRVLGAFYLRLTGSAVDIYRYLEPLYNDYRKLKRTLADGQFAVTRMDEFIEELLTEGYSCDITLGHINERKILVRNGTLDPRKSVLEDDFEEEEEKEEDDQQIAGLENRNHAKVQFYYYQRGRSPTRERKRDSHRYRDQDYDRDNEKKRGRDCYREWRDWDCARWQSSSRERRECDGDERRRKRSRRSASPKKMKMDGSDHPDPEIAEANRIRVSLGLKPLKL